MKSREVRFEDAIFGNTRDNDWIGKKKFYFVDGIYHNYILLSFKIQEDCELLDRIVIKIMNV